jgi:sulfite reductase (NADPH) hemoprotein beta-component
VPAIERLVLGYLELRSNPYETFLQSYQRLGAAPFRAMIYPAQKKAA